MRMADSSSTKKAEVYEKNEGDSYRWLLKSIFLRSRHRYKYRYGLETSERGGRSCGIYVCDTTLSLSSNIQVG